MCGAESGPWILSQERREGGGGGKAGRQAPGHRRCGCGVVWRASSKQPGLLALSAFAVSSSLATGAREVAVGLF